MKAALKIYLTDHLAGAALAIRILKTLRAHYGSTETGVFAQQLLQEILADESVLLDLNRRLEGSAGGWKRSVARLFSRLGARMVVQQKPEPFGTFEALETVAIGIQGKHALWVALRQLSEPRFAGTDFDGLLQRASLQHAAVESMRLSLVKEALSVRSHR